MYTFEDNEAVIKRVIKRRSPTIRHVSKTHGVALDWLLNRINLEPKIQIKYVDTQNQFADTLTIGSLSRDEWNHLLRLFNIMSFSMFSCSHFSNFLSDPIEKQSVMSKRGQESTSDGKAKTNGSSEGDICQRGPWSAKENPPQDLGHLVNPVNDDEEHGDHTSIRRFVRNCTNS